MIYVVDTSVFRTLFRHFYETRFPSLWENINKLVTDGRLLSVREVIREVQAFGKEDRLALWVKDNSVLFQTPTDEEIAYVQAIFKNHHFQANIERIKLLEGGPVADPFLVAKAKALNGTVVTQEEYKPNGVKIPNMCEFMNVRCTNLEGLMELEKWVF